MRVIQEADARKQESAQATPERGTDFQSVENMARMAMPLTQAIRPVSPQTCSGGLKKRTQYDPALMDVTPFVEGDYGNMPAGGIEENKANSNPNKANSKPIY